MEMSNVKSITIAVLMVCIPFFSVCYGQVNIYSFAQSVQQFAQASHGNELGTSANAGLRSFLDATNPAGSAVATSGPGFPIGFEFVYNGIVYDRFGVMNSGWICLGRSEYGNNAVDIGQLQYQPLERAGPANDTLRARIVGLDANLVGNGTSSSLTYELIGDSTDLVLIIKWKNYRLFQSSGTNATNINFEIRLNAIDQSIDIRYGQMSALNYPSTTSCNIGLGGRTTGDFNNRKTLVPRNWNTTVAGGLYTDDCVVQSTAVLPEFGLNFHWSPPPCPPVTSAQSRYITTNSFDVYWSSPAGLDSTEYEYQLSTTPTPPVSGSNTMDTSVSFSMLEPATLYYVHLRTKCTPVVYSPWTTLTVRTLCNPLTIPYFESFDTVNAPVLPGCISVYNNSADSKTWITEQWTGLSQPNALAIPYEPSLANDDWVFLPGLELEGDTTYILSLDYVAYGPYGLMVYAGTSPAIDSMILLDTFFANVESESYRQNFLFYTPAGNGVYYFAIRSQHADIRVDNIAIEEYQCTPPDSIHLEVNEINNVVVAWNPTGSAGLAFEYTLSAYEMYPPADILTTIEDTILFDDLLPARRYFFYIRTNCGSGSFSPWQLFPFETRSDIDECQDALLIIPSNYAECEGEQYNTRGATDSGLPASSCSGLADDDVWFKFVATTRSHKIAVTNQCLGGGGGGGTLSPLPTIEPSCQPLIVELRRVNCGDTLIACMEVQPGISGALVETQLLAGSTYYIRVFGKDTSIAGQNFGLCVSTYSLEPNNSCGAAILLPVSTGTCQTSPVRDIAGADASNTPASSCAVAPYFDLWYKFVTTATTHIIEANFTDGGNGVVDVFDGSCAGLLPMACADSTTSGAEQITLTGLTIGDTLFVRVFDAGGVGDQMKVTLCIKVPTPNDPCANAIQINTVQGVTLANPVNGNSFSTVGSGACNGFFADDDLWYRFTAINDTHLIVVIPTSPSPMAMPVVELFEGDCNSASVGCSSGGELLAQGLVAGSEYYLRIYSAAYLTGRGNFRLGVTIPPPNIYCSSATPVQVNESQECGFVTSGTMIGAGVKNETWYSFTATHSSMVINVNDTLGMEMALYEACSGQFLTGEQTSGRLHYTNFIIGNTYFFKLYINVFPSNNYQYFQQPVSICIIESPSFDECTGALTLPTQAFCETMISGSTVGATPSITNGTCHPGQNDVWYSFVATAEAHRIVIHPGPGMTYVYGQVFKGGCGTIPLACFSDELGVQDAIVVLDHLQADSIYLLRVAVASPQFTTGEFSVCISSPPVNDECSNATVFLPGLTNNCNNSIPGTMIQATESLGRFNVWYLFTATSKTATIRVTPTSPGFDPGIKVWNPKMNPTLDDCVFTIFASFDDVHYDYQAEVMTMADLVVGNTYYVEVYMNDASDTTGTFDICIYDPADIMAIHSATFETYPFDTVVSAGTWNQPVVKVILNMSGIDFNKTIRSLKFSLSGTTSLSSVRKASVYVDTKVWLFNNEAVLPFSPFGKPGQGIEGQNPSPYLFGSPVDNPGDTMVFNGEYIIKGEKYGSSLGGPNNYQRFLYLVLELSCTAQPGDVIHATCEAITVDEETLVPLPGLVYSLPVVALDRYDTRGNGRWNEGSTWVCGAPPPMTPDCMPVNIYHEVYLDDTVQVGKVNIYFGKSLAVMDGAHLILGSSSNGPASGFADKMLSCDEGSLFVKDARIDINGAFSFGTASGERYGNGICCNDGQGSYVLSIGDTEIARDSTFGSLDYVPFCVAGGSYQELQIPSGNEVHLQEASPGSVQHHQLFRRAANRRNDRIGKHIRDYSLFDLDTIALEKLQKLNLSVLHLTLPLEGRDQLDLELQLVPHLLSGALIRSAPDMNVVGPSKGLHYRGTIKGKPGSLVTLSIQDDEVVGILSVPGSPDLVLGKLGNDDVYIAYQDHQIKEYIHFSCETSDEGEPYLSEQIQYKREERSAGDCIQLYVEVDHDIFLDKGGLVATQNYIEALCNQVIALYQAENINLTVSEILIWTAPSVYLEGTMTQTLEKFKSTRPSFNGDLGILLSYQFGGGLAQLNGLCTSEQRNSLAYAGIYPSYESVPTYSWSVEVVAHELGHLLGARHTHACVWNGNSTAIDGCYTPEGGCENIAELPANGGTIMSYCHLTEAGINFSEGFGLQPGNIMRYTVDQATCTQSCQTTLCALNEVSLVLKTDNLPAETTWMIRDSIESVIYKGGPYVISGHVYQKNFCLADGCYSLVILDSSNPNPGGTFIGINSHISADWNDGTTPPEKDYFRFLNANLYTDQLDINILDPGSFLYNAQSTSNIALNGSLTLGGGDDDTASTGFLVHTSGGGTGIMILDSLIVDGGYYTDNRHTRSSGNFVSARDVWIKQDAELMGGFGISGNMVNDGLFTSSLNRNLSFCGEMSLGHHYTNTTNSQTLSGAGLFRPDVSAPVPPSQAENQITMLRVDNTFSGLNLGMPLGIRNTLRLCNGRINNDASSLLTLGDSLSAGVLSTDPNNTQWWPETPFNGDIVSWDGGFVTGPFRRWFVDSTETEEGIMPIGKGMNKHLAGVYFYDTNGGYVTAEYKDQLPGVTGLPLTNEQNTSIGFVSPNGYWTATSTGTSSLYTMAVNAAGFTVDGVQPISALSSVRLIKRPANGTWQNSGSTTGSGPLALSLVKAEGLTSFSDFAIGLNCGNVVSTANDSGIGSLRYVLANCISSGDTVKFDSSLSLLLITSDTIILDKNVTIYASSQDNIIIQGAGVHSLVKVQPSVTARLQNLELVTGDASDGKAVINQGTLSLHDIEIFDSGTGGSVVLNQGSLIVIGQTGLHMQ